MMKLNWVLVVLMSLSANAAFAADCASQSSIEDKIVQSQAPGAPETSSGTVGTADDNASGKAQK